MFSQEDREMILHIRDLFSLNGNKPKYNEEANTVILPVSRGKSTHLLFMTYEKNILRIFSIVPLDIQDCSVQFLKYVLNLNFDIKMGGLCWSETIGRLLFQLSVPMIEKPTKEELSMPMRYFVEVMDENVLELISYFYESRKLGERPITNTFH